MPSSSFNTVTARTASLVESPAFVHEAWANMTMISLRLQEAEQIRLELKKRCDALGLALTETLITPPPNLPGEQGDEILLNQESWREELTQLLKTLSQLDSSLTYSDDYNNDLQMRYRTNTLSLLEKIHDAQQKKAEQILEVFNLENADLKLALIKALTQPDIQEAYAKTAGVSKSKSFTQKLKSLFSRK